MRSTRAGAAARAALGNTRIRRLVVAYAGSVICEWAVWLAVLVYAQDEGGSALAGWVALGLLVPCLLVAPFVGRAIDGRRPIRSLLAVHVTEAIALTAAAVLASQHAPVGVVLIPTAISLGGVAFVRPSYASIAPGLATSARELTSASLLAGFCDSGSILVGPAIATGFLALGGPTAVLAACAVVSVGGTLSTLGLLEHDRRRDTVVSERRPSLFRVVRSLRGHGPVPSLLAVLGAQHVLMGTIGVMFVVLAADELGMGASGAGVLNIAFGAGAVTSGILSTLLVGRARLAPAVVVSLVTIVAALVTLGAATTVVVAIVTLALIGCTRSLLDVTARILLQRSAPPQYLASVFAFIEVLTSAGLATGTGLAQLTVATVGARAGLVVLGGILAVVAAVTVRQVWRADHSADVPVVTISLLRSMPLFAPLPPPALESVARAGVERELAPGFLLIKEGDEGDCYYAIASGEVEVTQQGRVLRRAGRGNGVGEIALLADVPRSATVTTLTPTTVIEIDRRPFLLAVTGNEPALSAAWHGIAQLDGVDHIPRPVGPFRIVD